MLIQQDAPHFKATACMPDNSFKEVSLSDFKGKYVVLYFWPADFTFVCASETIAFHNQLKEFQDQGAVVLGVSCDTEFVHKAWKTTEKTHGGLGTPINHPLIADVNKEISRAYDVLLPCGLPVRGVFLIGKDGKVRAEMKNDLPLGRNVEEVLRVLETIKTTDENAGQVCPANWKKGKPMMKASTEGVIEYLTKNT
jgi:alkyl hydroperoxide reductase subunit AhpC